MKNDVFSFLLILFCSAISATRASYVTNEAEARILPTSTSAIETSTRATTISTFRDDLNDSSTSEILLSDIDASDKIEKGIMNAFTEFSSNCNLYKRMQLSLNNFTFPKKSVNVNLGTGKATFYNITAKEYTGKIGLYSTLIKCDSSRKAKVAVTLPKFIEISANVKIIETLDLSNGLVSQSMHEGLISTRLKNESISKELFLQENNFQLDDDVTRQISYWNTDVSLDIDAKYQKLIYRHLEEFLNEVESSLEQFFVDQLNAELSKNKISIHRSCSKIINVGKNSKNINFNSPTFLNSDLYVIQNISVKSWNGASPNAGPVVIEGISHFNSIELSISATELSSPSEDGFFYSFPDYQEKKEMTVRFETNGLKGKLYWSYNSKQRSFPFSIDFILFEMKRKKIYKYKNILSSDRYIMCSRSEENTMNIDVYLGNIQIKSPSVCENENEFMNFVLSEYLKTIIRDSLKNSLWKKLQNTSSDKYC